jgi:Flp pilus assembly protein TadB
MTFLEFIHVLGAIVTILPYAVLLVIYLSGPNTPQDKKDLLQLATMFFLAQAGVFMINL